MTKSTVSDALIIGAGPAGVSCALWLKQLGFHPLLIEKNPRCGGLQLSNPYTNTWIASSANVYGKDVAQAMHDNVLGHNIAHRLSTQALVVSKTDGLFSLALSNGEHVVGKNVVLAGGVAPSTGGMVRRAGLLIGPGAAVANTNFTGAKVAILGGGDSAFENFGFVTNRGAANVTIFARTIKASPSQLERVPPQCVVVGHYDVDHRSNTINGEQFDHILVLYGYEVNKDALLGLEPTMKHGGFVWTDENCRTSLEGVYAIGELAQRAHPCCTTSMADGVIAAKAIQRTLEATKTTQFLGLVRRSVGAVVKVTP